MKSKKWRNVSIFHKKILSIFLFDCLENKIAKQRNKKNTAPKEGETKTSFSRINKRKAISLAIVYDFLLFLRRPQSVSLRSEICFDFPSTLKLFAFMINYEIPLEFYISSEKKGAKTFPFIKYLSDEKFRNFPSHHLPFNGNFGIFLLDLSTTSCFPLSTLNSIHFLELRSVKTYILKSSDISI